jgi:DNA (cytosine-5)-methyltransferase 1
MSEIKYIGQMSSSQNSRVIDPEGISYAVTNGETDVSPALRATDYKAPHCVWENSANYRIRKLTPKECFRLMGVSETDIEKIQNCGVSQSQQYKMAGNSIVVDVLEHIFRKLFVDTGQESQQLLLF